MITEQQIKKGFLQLGKPIWQIMKENQPERRALEADRIKDLLAQREAIDWELEIYGYRQPQAQQKTYTPLTEKWQYSLSGFHNPIKHKGLTAEEFFNLYIKRMGNKKGAEYIEMLMKNKPAVMTFIKSRFKRTLKI